MRWLAGLRCGRVRKRRWRYLDNTLSARERAWVDRHLAQCIGCRAEFARAAFALESLQKGLPLDPFELPSRSKRWATMIPPLLALLGLVGGLWLARFYRSAQQELRPPSVASVSSPTKPEPRAPSAASASSPTKPVASAPMPASRLRDAGVAQATYSPTPRKTSLPHSVGKGQEVRVKRQPVRKKAHSARFPNKPKIAVPPEGAIEVYDESGQLVKREQMRGPR